MKRTIVIIAALAALYLLVTNDPEAADGRGGGGRGGGSHGGGGGGASRGGGGHMGGGGAPHMGGGGHPAATAHVQSGGFHGGRVNNSISRTPSMSLAEPRAWHSGNANPHGFTGGVSGHHPSAGEVQQFMHGAPGNQFVPHGTRSPTFAPSPSLPGQAGSGVRAPPGRFAPSPSLAGHAGSGVMPSPGRFGPSPSLAGQAGSGVVSFRSTGNWNRLHTAPAAFHNSFPRQLTHNRQVANQVRSRIRQNRPGVFNSFNDQFFRDHHFHPRNFFPGANWWCSAAWPGVNSWLGWGWNYPLYYDDSGDVYPDTMYEAYPTANAEQETTGEPVVSNQQAIQGDWLSLGVFAVGQNTTDATYSNIVMQLALNRQGQISGTYYNSATDQTYQVEGAVDQSTQQAEWGLSNDPSAPTMSTGIYNLTQDVTNVQVQFPDGTLQNWALVRLNS